FKGLLRYFWKQKWLILIVPILCASITYFLVKDLPKQYKSQAQIVTGITERFQEIISGGQLDFFRVNQQFGNLMEQMGSKRVIDALSYHLIIHDLSAPAQAFNKLPEELTMLSPEQRAEVIALYKERLANRSLIGPKDNGKFPLFDYLEKATYDYRSLIEKLVFYRNGESDYINVEFTSLDPEMSTFVVNSYVKEFIDYYTANASASQGRSLALLDSVLHEKQAVMAERNTQLDRKSTRLNSSHVKIS